jgi:ribonuclease P/MRP protein subunit POP5
MHALTPLLLLYMPPSLRERRRYLLFEVLSERAIDKWELLKEIWDSLYSLYGDLGASESKVWLIDYRTLDGATGGRGILRCAHQHVEEVRASLACIHSVNNVRVGIRVIRTSGTMKGLSP